jgi:hypothetical protein
MLLASMLGSRKLGTYLTHVYCYLLSYSLALLLSARIWLDRCHDLSLALLGRLRLVPSSETGTLLSSK